MHPNVWYDGLTNQRTGAIMKYDIIIVGVGTPNVYDAARCKQCGDVAGATDVPDAYAQGARHQREVHAR
jgi:hypothetical protein